MSKQKRSGGNSGRQSYQRGPATTPIPETPSVAPAAAAPIQDEAKSREAFKSRLLTVCGIGIIAMALVQQAPSFKNVGKKAAEDGGASGATVDAETLLRNRYWANPSIALYERYFCRGVQRARSCSERPLHPFVPVYKELWNTVPAPLKKDPVVHGETLSKDVFDRISDVPVEHSQTE